MAFSEAHCQGFSLGTPVSSRPVLQPVRGEASLALFAVTHCVTVSMSAFLACHPCCCAGLSLAWGLNFRALVCGIF